MKVAKIIPFVAYENNIRNPLWERSTLNVIWGVNEFHFDNATTLVALLTLSFWRTIQSYETIVEKPIRFIIHRKLILIQNWGAFFAIYLSVGSTNWFIMMLHFVGLGTYVYSKRQNFLELKTLLHRCIECFDCIFAFNRLRNEMTCTMEEFNCCLNNLLQFQTKTLQQLPSQ